ASILASDTFTEGGPTKRPAVQVGDPFAEKVLIECCLELFQKELVEGIQDLLEAIESRLPEPDVSLTVVIPYDRGDLVSSLHDAGAVESGDY
ncbi:hypothetical protein IAE22_34335, partial [Bacillus sp. S34]|nr:hypothetical protein [Bacillus sp. S34]